MIYLFRKTVSAVKKAFQADMMPLLADKTVPPIERLADKIVPLTELMGALLKEDKGAEGRVDRVDFLAVD